jgi:2'-5' RNA ligase
MGKRLFVAVDLDLASDIAGVQSRFDGIDGLRYTDPEQTHITLKFLGDTDTERIPEILTTLEDAIEGSGVEPFEVELGGLGVFPSLSYISVIWVGVQNGETELTALHEAVETHTTAIGFSAADHEFTPHATVARMDHADG